MNWPIKTYLNLEHPIQQEIIRRLSDIIGIPQEEFIVEKDDCGAPTFLLTLAQMAKLYANLCSSNNPEYEKVTRAMDQYPEYIAGPNLFDTELIKRSHGQLISKGGAEGIQCIGRISQGIGMAIKIEDGSKRAKHAVAIHLLRQLDWMTPTALDELSQISLKQRPNILIDVEGELKIA